MSLSATYHRSTRVFALCGLLLALAIATGCGPSAPPSKLVTTNTLTHTGTNTLTNSVTAVQTNLADEYTSVFEDLPPQKGRDPFFPGSHRRDPAPTASLDPHAHVEPVLVLKALIHTSKHSQVVINNQSFEVGDDEDVRVPNGKVHVRCIEIGDDFVKIQVEGEEPTLLKMEQKKY